MRLEKQYRENPDIVKAIGQELPGIENAAANIAALPCPFCGVEPVVNIGLVLWQPALSIRCPGCGVSTARLCAGTVITGKTFSCLDRLYQSAETWNRRTGARI